MLVSGWSRREAVETGCRFAYGVRDPVVRGVEYDLCAQLHGTQVMIASAVKRLSHRGAHPIDPMLRQRVGEVDDLLACDLVE